MRWEPAECRYCGATYNKFNTVHRCHEHREELEKAINDWRDMYVELKTKYYTLLKELKLPEPTANEVAD